MIKNITCPTVPSFIGGILDGKIHDSEASYKEGDTIIYENSVYKFNGNDFLLDGWQRGKIFIKNKYWPNLPII